MTQSIPSLIPYVLSEDTWMVPCVLNARDNKFIPISNPVNRVVDMKKIQNRKLWMTHEDEVLQELARRHGIKAWSLIARELNLTIHNGLAIRLGKQCRERYFNHLDPAVNKKEWSNYEDFTILKKKLELGNRWCQIAKFLDGRTENQVKNRFKSLSKRAKKDFCDEQDQLGALMGEIDDLASEEMLSGCLPLFIYEGSNSENENLVENFGGFEASQHSNEEYMHYPLDYNEGI